MLYQTENPHGGDIYSDNIRIDFSASLNPLGTPESIKAAMRKAIDSSEHYPDPYCRKAIQAIGAYESVPAEYILMGNGAAELIFTFCDSVQPKSALIPVPTFSEYETALQRRSCKISYYQLREENEFRLDSDFPRLIEEEQPEAVFLCHPNNPTGLSVQQPLLSDIIHRCKKIGCWLFIDECFSDLCDGHDSAKAFLSEYPRLFILKAFTKSFALAGIRCGYALSSNPELLRSMSQNVQPWNVSTVAQAAAEMIPSQTVYLAESRELIRTERNWLKQTLEELGFTVCPSDSNFLLFRGQPELDSELKKEGILIRNCSNYASLGCGWYRIAVRKHEENVLLIQTLRNLLGKEK